MSPRKKNMGRVKHYRHSFYSGPQRIKRAAVVLVVLLVLFAVGWIIGPHVIDFGTRTWYSIRRGGEEASSSSQSQQAMVPESQPESVPEPTPEPTPVPAQVQDGKWSLVSMSGVDTPEKAAATAQQMAEQGVRYAVMTLKDEQGYIYYASSLPGAAQSVAATTFDAAAAAEAFRAAGVEPVAQICTFRDPKAPYADRTMGIHYQDSDYFWLDAAGDAGGKPWLDPYSGSAIVFVNGLIQEARTMGFEQIILTGLQFPFTDGSNATYQVQNGESKPACLARLISGWQAEAEAEGGVLWVEYSLAQAAGKQPASLGGGTLDQLGVQHLVIRTNPEEDPAVQEELLAAARAAAAAGGAEHVVLRQGNEAHFDA